MLEYCHQLRGLLGTEMVHEHEGLKVALCLEFLCLQHAAKSMTKIGEGASCITHHVISWACHFEAAVDEVLVLVGTEFLPRFTYPMSGQNPPL